MTSHNLALVLGATGGIGGETARALSRHGWTIRALSRDPVASAAALGAEAADWDWRRGDALDEAAVRDAGRGASCIIHAVNPRGYHNWAGLVLPMLENTIAAARAAGARILLPGTIYNYGADAGPLLREDSPQNPTTRKGAIRVAMERRLRMAAAEGVRSVVLRAGDFFGPRPGQSWFSQCLVSPGRPVRRIIYPGRPGIGHAWAYLPDMAESFAQLAARDATLPDFGCFHFDGIWDADGTLLIEAIRRAAGKPNLPVWRFPWPLLWPAAPFNEMIREMMEMRWLWRVPARLDNTRLTDLLGAEPHTAADDAVAATLRGLGVIE